MDGAPSTSTSVGTVRGLHHLAMMAELQPSSQPSSPRSSALPSPPDSPSIEHSDDDRSVSSFPSVSSSFFYSSGAASPPHTHHHQDHDQGLIIPHLTLGPSSLGSLRRPTIYGRTLGKLKLLVLGKRERAVRELVNALVDDNEDIVSVSEWVGDGEGGTRTLAASTDWVERVDGFGVELVEPRRNVEVVEFAVFEDGGDTEALIERLLDTIHAPALALNQILDPTSPASSSLAHLISSPSTPLYTALVLLTPSPPSPSTTSLIDALSSHIPVILFPSNPHPHPHPRRLTNKLSHFRPALPTDLRTGLFRAPEVVAKLREEAAERFLRWREVERGVGRAHRREKTVVGEAQTENEGWTKNSWESELSRDFALRLRRSSTQSRPQSHLHPLQPHPHPHHPLPTPLDPLHLPSLFAFGLSILGPLKDRMFSLNWLSVVGVFCAGIGIGVWLS